MVALKQKFDDCTTSSFLQGRFPGSRLLVTSCAALLACDTLRFSNLEPTVDWVCYFATTLESFRVSLTTPFAVTDRSRFMSQLICLLLVAARSSVSVVHINIVGTHWFQKRDQTYAKSCM